MSLPTPGSPPGGRRPSAQTASRTDRSTSPTLSLLPVKCLEERLVSGHTAVILKASRRSTEGLAGSGHARMSAITRPVTP